MEDLQRIQELEDRVQRLEAEVKELKSTVAVKPQPQPQPIMRDSHPGQYYNQYIPPVQSAPQYAQQQYSQPAPQPAQQYYQPQQARTQARSQVSKQSMESFIGKYGMAIGASLLIFIAIVMFAVWIIPVLGDAVKIAAMFIFSGAFIVAGELNAKKKGVNKWNTSLTGCGTGAVFVSLFVTYGYFEAINIVALYVLLVLWAAALCFLGRKKSFVFTIIGQTGIFVAAVFSAIQMHTLDECLVVLVMLVLAEVSFFINDLLVKNYWSSFSTWCGTIIAFTLVTIKYLAGVYGFGGNEVNTVDIIILVFTLVVIMYSSLVQILFLENEKHTITFVVQTILTLFPMEFLLIYSLNGYIGNLESERIGDLLILTIALIDFFVVDRFVKLEAAKIATYTAEIIFALFIFIANFNMVVCDHESISVIGGILAVLIEIGACVYSRFKRNLVARFYSLTMIILIIAADFDNSIFGLILVVTMLAFAVAERITEKEEHVNVVYDNVLYLWIIGMLAYTIHLINDIHKISGSFELFCIIMTALQIFAYKKKFAAIKVSYEKTCNIMFYIVNVFLVVFYTTEMMIFTKSPFAILYGLLITALVSINVKSLLENYTWAGAYVAFKYTYVCLMFLIAYESYGIMLSVAFLVIALASIILGFRMKYKSMRLYGLVLSIASIVKLVLIDVNYEDLLLRAVGFLICGFLCFGISYIYNRLDKQEIQ
ncbi:MAG: DUF2339 domain-containing protein [Pseudobutyrivibrio ruminis]|uniref:DUF2339 domain-containing protein n=1 Tax=Pseudobutyrivibrio ruminis TaxID=46206 RepID=UPI0026EF9576|nr:DUF2339 domain-containing protein [Pseudobutyrivibrio ruminis]MBE5912715.1 DUF2339 domain-containing protein [Pseudobutyrivibrio ruminis]